VERCGYEVAVAVAEGLPETEKNAAAMGIRPPFSKVLTGFSFLVFYNFLLFPLFFAGRTGMLMGRVGLLIRAYNYNMHKKNYWLIESSRYRLKKIMQEPVC
jgi:hypothetical protein